MKGSTTGLRSDVREPAGFRMIDGRQWLYGSLRQDDKRY